MIKGKLIIMQKNLGLGHRGDILITTRERVDKNLLALAKEILDEETAFEFVRRWNAFPELLAACENLARGQMQHPTFKGYVDHAVWVATEAITAAKPEQIAKG